jgi:hypothetical protein
MAETVASPINGAGRCVAIDSLRGRRDPVVRSYPMLVGAYVKRSAFSVIASRSSNTGLTCSDSCPAMCTLVGRMGSRESSIHAVLPFRSPLIGMLQITTDGSK